MLESGNESGNGFAGSLTDDNRYFLRIFLSLLPPGAEILVDISDLVDGGYYSDNQPVCKEAIQSLSEYYPANTSIIILAEGSSDIAVLEISLAILFPHLVGYYSFFDFHGSNAGGGAPELVKIVKSFAATGITNRVVALFDNDSAGHDAKSALDIIRLPNNITVQHYPGIELLEKYPTVGPSGRADLDVNGTAGSIEMYLGIDVLKSDEELSPVLWKGYVEKLKRYQGEVRNKKYIQDRWKEKASRCEKDPSLIKDDEWQDLKTIWESIFSAFS